MTERDWTLLSKRYSEQRVKRPDLQKGWAEIGVSKRPCMRAEPLRCFMMKGRNGGQSEGLRERTKTVGRWREEAGKAWLDTLERTEGRRVLREGVASQRWNSGSSRTVSSCPSILHKEGPENGHAENREVGPVAYR